MDVQISETAAHFFASPRVTEIRPSVEIKVTRPAPRRSLCENAHKLDPHR